MSKNRRRTKAAAVVMAAVMMAVSLMGCGGGSAREGGADTQTKAKTASEQPAGEPKTYGEDETLQIAYIGWGFTDETAKFYVRNFEQIEEKFNVKYTLSDAWGTSTSAEDVVEVLPSLIEAGAQAVIVHSMSAKIVEICDNAGVYFTLSGEVILDENLQKLCDESPYYVGTVALNDVQAGYDMVKYLKEECGSTNIIYTRTSTRNLDENRLKGAKQACEELGVTLVGEYTGQDTAAAIRDFLASNPEIDGVVNGNGSSGEVDVCVQTLENEGKADLPLVSTCSPVGLETAFDNGTLNMVMGGEGMEPTICSMLLINAMKGQRVEEAPILGYVSFFPITDSNGVRDYSKFFSGETLPLSMEALEANFLKKNNPELNNQYILDYFANEYNLEALLSTQN